MILGCHQDNERATAGADWHEAGRVGEGEGNGVLVSILHAQFQRSFMTRQSHRIMKGTISHKS